MKQKKIKIEPRIKLSYNIYYTKGLGECAEGWEWPREKRQRSHVPVVRSFCHNFAKKNAIKRLLRKKGRLFC